MSLMTTIFLHTLTSGPWHWGHFVLYPAHLFTFRTQGGIYT